MKRLGALINIVADANVNSSISLNIEEILTSFSNHVATNNDIEEADTNNVGDEAGDVVVVIPDLLDENVKRRIEKYLDEVTDKLLELAPLQESKDNIINLMKKTREYWLS